MIRKILLFSGCLIFSALAWATVESTVSHRPGDFIQSIQNDPLAGEKVYNEFCASCHAVKPEISVGAPRFRVASDWKPYAAMNIDSLLKMADEGINNMPPRGGCFECTDANLKAAILYMQGF